MYVREKRARLGQGGIKVEGAVSRPIPTQIYLTNPSPNFQNSELPAVVVWCNAKYHIVKEISQLRAIPLLSKSKLTRAHVVLLLTAHETRCNFKMSIYSIKISLILWLHNRDCQLQERSDPAADSKLRNTSSL